MEIASPGYRLIFIDIDGVLNRHWHGSLIEPFVYSLMERFAELVRVTGATLVLSSAWRLTKSGREGARETFLRHGLPPFLSCTPRMRGPRGNEVLYWLQLNTLNVLQDAPIKYKHNLIGSPEFSEKHFALPVQIKVAQYVVIDDRDFATRVHGGFYRRLLTEYGHFVHIDSNRGLSRRDAEEARRLIETEMKPLKMAYVNGDGGGDDSDDDDDDDNGANDGNTIGKSNRIRPPPTPSIGHCQYCEKRVQHGIRESRGGPLYCNPDCLYRHRGVRNIGACVDAGARDDESGFSYEY